MDGRFKRSNRSFYNSSKNKIKHCYLLPFTVQDNLVSVFLIEKKTFSSKDGFVHNNPGQLTIVGGQNKNNEDYSDAAIREFKEEIGISLDKNNVFDTLDKNKYNATFYKVDDPNDFINLIKSSSLDSEEFIEVVSYQWFSLSDAFDIMDSSTYSNNLPNIDSIVIDKYMNNLRDNKDSWKFLNEGNEFKKYLTSIFYNDYLFDTIMNDIREFGENSTYYYIFSSFLIFYFYKRSSIDWFENILEYIDNNFDKFIK